MTPMTTGRSCNHLPGCPFHPRAFSASRQNVLNGYARVEDTGSVARLRSYFPVIPMLRGLNLVVHHQSKGLPVGEDGSSGPDPIDAALVFARDLWLMHYCKLRTAVDGRQPEDVLRELGGGNGDGPSPAH